MRTCISTGNILLIISKKRVKTGLFFKLEKDILFVSNEQFVEILTTNIFLKGQQVFFLFFIYVSEKIHFTSLYY